MIPGGLIFVESRSLKYLAEACGGRLAQGVLDTVVARISTDSRRIERGDCFLALPGERFDGHDFVSEAARQGAAAGSALEVITSVTLSRLYGTPIEVLHTSDGRLVVVGEPEPPHHHSNRHQH